MSDQNSQPDQHPEAALPNADAQPTLAAMGASVPVNAESDAQPTRPLEADAASVAATQPTVPLVAEPVAEAVASQPTIPLTADPNLAPAQPAPADQVWQYHSPTAAYPSSYPAQPAAPGAQPVTSGTQPVPPTYAPVGSGAAFGYAAAPAGPSAPRSPKSRLGLTIAAAAVVGALVGGGAGVGTTLGVLNSQPKASPSSSQKSIAINNPESVSNVAAVAANATPSVVTVNVVGNEEGGSGSGVILTADGYVLTNTHVVTLGGTERDVQIKVATSDGKLYDATIIGTDPTTDLAVIKLKGASGLKPIEFADSDKVNVGDQAVAIGAPLELPNTVTDGIVSAVNRSIQIKSSALPKSQASAGDQQDPGNGNSGPSPFDFWNNPKGGDGQQQPRQQEQQQQSSNISIPVLQTDASINPGNSGGALLNSKGQLIGINVAILTAGSSNSGQNGSIGVGFAVTSNVAKRIAKELMDNGKATHGVLGVSAQPSSADPKSVSLGAIVKDVVADGAAAKAGLKSGDLITALDGKPVTNPTDLTALVRAAAGGSAVELTILRDGKTQTIDVTLGSLPE